MRTGTCCGRCSFATVVVVLPMPLLYLVIFFYTCIYNPSNIFALTRLVLTRHVTEYALPPLKLGNIRVIFPNFPNFAIKIKLNVKMGERFAFVTEDINQLVDKSVPESSKKSTSYRL